MTRTVLQHRRPNETREVRLGDAVYSVCVGFDLAGEAREVFANGPREGSDMQAVVADACVLISIALQNGITPGELGHSLGRVPRWHDGHETEGPASIIGLIVETISKAGELTYAQRLSAAVAAAAKAYDIQPALVDDRLMLMQTWEAIGPAWRERLIAEAGVISALPDGTPVGPGEKIDLAMVCIFSSGTRGQVVGRVGKGPLLTVVEAVR